MGSNESQTCIYYDMYSSLATVALSAQPPGVNELCVCVCILLPHIENFDGNPASQFNLIPARREGRPVNSGSAEHFFVLMFIGF